MSHHEVIVIGGGQAGLAIGHHLSRQGRDFTILEAADGPAAAWRARWDSLRLFTPARYDSLPGTPFPGDPGHHPTRDEVVAYLSDYARDLPVRYHSRVERLARADGGSRLELAGGTLTADQVVVATGPFQVPRVPALAGRSTRGSGSCTAPSTGAPRGSARGRCWSSAEATRATRSPPSSARPTRSTWPSARASRPSPSASSAATSSTSSPRSARCARPPTRGSAAG